MERTLHFVLSTIADGKRNILYSFPQLTREQTEEGTISTWLKFLVNPKPYNDVFHTDRIIYFWTSTEGNCYSMVVRDQKEKGSAKVYTLFTGYYAVCRGRELVEAWKKLEGLFTAGQPTDEEVKAVLDTVQLRREVGERVLNPEGEIGYVTYDSEEGLYKRLANIEQRSYASYRRIALIPAEEVSEESPVGVDRITEPIRLIYYIDYPLPKGVTVSQTSIRAGDVLKITYSKPGFAPITVPVRIDGVSNPHITLKAPRMQILVPRTINFGHVVQLECVDAEGNPVNDVRINTRGNRCEVRPGNLIFFEEPKDGYVISVLRTSVGRVSRVTITKADLDAGYKQLVFHDSHGGTFDDDEHKSSVPRSVMYLLSVIVGLYLLYAAAMGLRSGTVWPFEETPPQTGQAAPQPSPSDAAPQP